MNASYTETDSWREYRGDCHGAPAYEECSEGYWECSECGEEYDDEEEANDCCRRYCGECDEFIEDGKCGCA